MTTSTSKTESAHELIKLRISYLLKRLNANYKVKCKVFLDYATKKDKVSVDKSAMNKKDIKAVKKELVGYGIIPLRVKDESVSILTDDELFLSTFNINGRIETSVGTIIGYYCPDCCTVVTVKDAWKLFVLEPQTRLMNCNMCNSYDVRPLFTDFIIGDMGY